MPIHPIEPILFSKPVKQRFPDLFEANPHHSPPNALSLCPGSINQEVMRFEQIPLAGVNGIMHPSRPVPLGAAIESAVKQRDSREWAAGGSKVNESDALMLFFARPSLMIDLIQME